MVKILLQGEKNPRGIAMNFTMRENELKPNDEGEARERDGRHYLR